MYVYIVLDDEGNICGVFSNEINAMNYINTPDEDGEIYNDNLWLVKHPVDVVPDDYPEVIWQGSQS